jgi:hypothetical protein
VEVDLLSRVPPHKSWTYYAGRRQGTWTAGHIALSKACLSTWAQSVGGEVEFVASCACLHWAMYAGDDVLKVGRALSGYLRSIVVDDFSLLHAHFVFCDCLIARD